MDGHQQPQGRRRRAAAEAADSATLHRPLLRRAGSGGTYRQLFTPPTERKLCTRVQLEERANCISGMSMFMRRSRSPASDSTKRDQSLSRILPRRRILIGSASRARESISEWISVPLRPGGDWCLHSDLSLWEFGPDFRRKRELQICLSRRHL